MAFGRQSTIKEILDHPQARAVLLKHVPGADKHPDLPSALYMSLQEAATYPEAGLAPAKLEALVADLEAIEE
jgi:hypothetical protein